MKQYWRLATRYDKTASVFKAFLALISIRMWLSLCRIYINFQFYKYQ
ncbi:transposase [Paenibacillus polymyxa]|nr:transposase [Paenibacillus polymyxa]